MSTNKFVFKKRLGQNFLNNENILKKIVSISNLKNKNIIEIGPGKGALTKHIIAQEPKSLFLIEKDKSLKPYLEKLIQEIINFQIGLSNRARSSILIPSFIIFFKIT